jgi:predicted glycoside hydrolase/deacetylase ChbG (UPF0249 family)
MLPGILPIVARLAKQAGISGVRWASERRVKLWRILRQNKAAAPTILQQYLQSRVLELVSLNSRARLYEAGILFPADFYGITQTGFLDYEAIAMILSNLRPGSSELMCHPGYVDETVPPYFTRLRAERQHELDALTQPETLQLVAQLGIHLIDYPGLMRPERNV